MYPRKPTDPPCPSIDDPSRPGECIGQRVVYEPDGVRDANGDLMTKSVPNKPRPVTIAYRYVFDDTPVRVPLTRVIKRALRDGDLVEVKAGKRDKE
jgi:hypothetical protein